MKLHFDRTAVNKLLEHTRAAKTHSALYEDPKTAKPGLWLVGDDGVDFLALSELDKALATYRPDAKLIIDVTQGSLAIIYYTRRKPKSRAPK